MGIGALTNNVKNFFGFGDEFDEYEEELEEIEEEEPVERHLPKVSAAKKQKVIPLRGQQINTNKIVVLKPSCFNNSTQVADELKLRRPVVINVGSLDPDEARRVVDFIAGTVYGLGGNMQRVAGGIFLATPSQVDILGEVFDDNGAGIEWSMF